VALRYLGAMPRPQEIAALRVTDVDLMRGIIHPAIH
jgi:hypothetical protein